ncbi:MAG: TonB-dependent receptor [Ignavibacteriae bacterium]|nr:TonB-dependent receptor [Ignavibacteriota bacterium]
MKLYNKIYKLKSILILVCIIFAYSTMFAGSTGKIAGKVTDANTGEELLGANILILEGSASTGAAADINGEYIIINLPPGTYKLRISMIGYKSLEISDIRVFIDRTVRIDAKLQDATIETDVVMVVATREAVEFDRTNSATYVSEEDIKNLPVTTLADIVQLQAGVIKDASGDFHIRGGRSREVAYMIDGVPVTNTFNQSGGSNVNVETNFVSELQVITGTFNAEYGSAQSGIINVVTKVPDNNLSGSMELLSGGYFSPNSPMYVGGLDNYNPLTDKEYKLSLSVPIDFFPSSLGKLGLLVNGRIEDTDGYLNGERRFMPEDGWDIAVYREWYRAIEDPPDVSVIPLPDEFHTGDGELVPMEWQKNYNFNTKLVYQPFSGFTASYSMFLSSGESQDFSNSWKFLPDAMPTQFEDKITHMLVLTHAPFNNFYYNLRYSFQQSKIKEYMYESADDPRYQTTSVNAWDPGSLTGFDFGGINSWDRDWEEQKINLINGDVTWQISKVIEFKTGFEFKSHDIYYRRSPMREVKNYEILQFPLNQGEITTSELPFDEFRRRTAEFEFGNIKLRESSPDLREDDFYFVEYTRNPYEGGAFAQTTLAMGEIILNAGLRFDYFYANDRFADTYYDVDPFNIGNDVYYEDVKSKTQISPRFGLSFPISNKGALRLSYGHFFQAPSFEKMFQNPVLENYTHLSVKNQTIGNPNLGPEKTVQYEVGLQQELISGFGLELSFFYKDISDLLGGEVLVLNNGTAFFRNTNKEYGNSKGLTLTLDYRSADGLFSTNIDYTYMTANGTSSNPGAIAYLQILSGPGTGAFTIANRRISYLEWDQTHSFNASMAIQPYNDLFISLIGRVGSALPYSPVSLSRGSGLPPSWWLFADRKPFKWNIDFRLSKNFNLFGLNCNANLKIYNLFNHLEQDRVNATTGEAGAPAYYPELGRLKYQRIAELGEFTFNEADYNPSMYSRPRFIQFGIGFQF